MSVEYDPEMKQKQGQEQEKRNSEASSFQTKLETDVYAKQSGSKRALSFLFEQEENEQKELLQKQSIEEKDTIQKYEAMNPSVDAVKSEKQETSRECEIQSVVIQDVEPGVSQPSLQLLAKELVKLETSTAASNVSSTDEMSHVQTENLNINEANLFTTTVQVGSVSVVENITGVETCITDDGNGIREKKDEAGPVTEVASSKDEKVNDNNENSPKSGTGLPFVDVKNTSDHKEGKNSDANIQNNNEDTSKDSDAYLQSSQGPQVKVSTVNDHSKADAENGPLSATLPADENYALDTNTKNTVVGNCASDNVQVQSLIAEDKQSFNNVQDACSDVLMPISCSVQDTSTVTENIDELSLKNHEDNSLLVKTEENVLDNLEATGIQSNRAILADGSQEENILENLEAPGIQSNMAILADGSQEKASTCSGNAILKPNGDSQSNLVVAKTEEKTLGSKEAPVCEPMVSTVSTYSPMPSVFEASTMPERELGEKAMEEPHGTSKLAGESENQMENKATEALEEQVGEMKVSCQVDHSETEAMSQESYVGKNVNQGGEILGNDVSPSKMSRERFSDSNLLVLGSVPKENGVASPTNVGKELAENGNAFSGENMESPSVINTLSAKQDSQSKDIADNYGTQVKSPEARQE
ncbi:hypothetical protein SUGI_1171190 [Cryptomeria japonica]|nr:hypothetical protein SUGI_1171190 [Cryptomeria japonica]